MVVFPVSVERALDMTVQCPHDADPRVHQRPAPFSRHDQRLHRCLPCGKVLLSLRQLHDEGGGVLQRDKLATARQRDRVFEGF